MVFMIKSLPHYKDVTLKKTRRKLPQKKIIYQVFNCCLRLAKSWAA